MIASQPAPKVIQVTIMNLRSRPKRRMSVLSFMPCMTEPAPRNRSALKKPCMSMWKIAKV